MALMIEWFGASPVPYYLVALAALLAFVALTVLPESRLTGKLECAFIVSAGLTLLAWRWPTFLWENPLNPDEGLWIAGALKMTADWVPWRGFDGTTSGPLTAYILALPAIFGARIDFFSTRIIGVCLLTATMAALYYGTKWMAGGRVARLTVLPAVLFLALTKDNNFLHFSSEVVPIFLTTTAFAASAYLARDPSIQRSRVAACAVAGFCLGSSIMAKLQSAPLVFVLLLCVLAGIAFAHRRQWKRANRELFVFLATLVFIPGGIAIVLLLTGEWDYAVQAYLTKSAGYIEQGIHVGPAFLFESSASYTAFLVSSLIVVTGAAAAIFWKGHRPSLRSIVFLAASVLLLVAAGFAIFTPHRPFQHYLFFSLLPLSCCTASILALVREGNLWERRETLFAGSCTGLFLISALGVAMASAPSPMVTEIIANSKTKSSKPALAISRYAPPGSRVAIWGACAEYYVQTQTIMATRYGQMGPIAPGPLQKYYERRLMRDLELSDPIVFVDAVHPGGFVYQDRTTQGYQTFPPLADYVRRKFEFKEEVFGVRIFVRNPSKESKPAEPVEAAQAASGNWIVYFNKGGGSEIYRLSGWSGTEADFTWTEGRVADLALPMADNNAALSVHMKLGGLLHPPELPYQNVAVYANGRKIADWEVKDNADFIAPIPAEVTKNAAELKLRLQIPNAASPQSLGLSYDNRILGVRCYFVELQRR